MKKFLLCSSLLMIGVTATFAQKDNVGIGTTKPDQSAVLDLSSTNKGFLAPRVTAEQRSAIQNPAQGLMVYQTDLLSGFYAFDGKDWKSIGGEKSVADASNWGITGNSGINPFHPTTPMFLGTTDAAGLLIKINNQNSGFIAHDDGTLRVSYGYQAGNIGISTGVANASFGFRALRSNTNGGFNLAFGTQALLNNTTGGNNVAMGTNAMSTNVSGGLNVAIGADALGNNTSGFSNIAIGNNALKGGVGANPGGNIAIGAGAGLNATGNGNMFIGTDAGANETGNGKLYIASGSSATPLIYGDFTAKYLAVGEVSAADRTAAVGGAYRLMVKGGMITEKIKVATAGTADWADYVFDADYKMMPLEEVEQYVKENKHLPNVPTTQEVMTNGNDLGKTDAKLLEKIEELTLYMIEMNKDIKALKNENAELKKKLGNK